MTAGQLTTSERIAVSQYLLQNTEPGKLKRIMEEIAKTNPPVNVCPPIQFIVHHICKHYGISIDEFRSLSRKKRFIYARMVCAKIVADLHTKPGKTKKTYIKKEIADQLFMKAGSLRNFIQKSNNFMELYEDFANEITYLSLNISWKYYKLMEDGEQ